MKFALLGLVACAAAVAVDEGAELERRRPKWKRDKIRCDKKIKHEYKEQNDQYKKDKKEQCFKKIAGQKKSKKEKYKCALALCKKTISDVLDSYATEDQQRECLKSLTYRQNEFLNDSTYPCRKKYGTGRWAASGGKFHGQFMTCLYDACTKVKAEGVKDLDKKKTVADLEYWAHIEYNKITWTSGYYTSWEDFKKDDDRCHRLLKLGTICQGMEDKKQPECQKEFYMCLGETAIKSQQYREERKMEEACLSKDDVSKRIDVQNNFQQCRALKIVSEKDWDDARRKDDCDDYTCKAEKHLSVLFLDYYKGKLAVDKCLIEECKKCTANKETCKANEWYYQEYVSCYYQDQKWSVLSDEECKAKRAKYADKQ